MDHASWRFAGLPPGEPPGDPRAATKATAPDLRGDRLLRQIEEGRNRGGLRHRGRRIPLRDRKNLRLPLSVSDENANAELLVPRSMPMLNLACAIT